MIHELNEKCWDVSILINIQKVLFLSGILADFFSRHVLMENPAIKLTVEQKIASTTALTDSLIPTC